MNAYRFYYGPMEPDIQQTDIIVAETDMGFQIIPACVVTDPESEIMHHQIAPFLEAGAILVNVDYLSNQWIARIHMPGYVDSTDWVHCVSEKDAHEYIIHTYASDDDPAWGEEE